MLFFIIFSYKHWFLSMFIFLSFILPVSSLLQYFFITIFFFFLLFAFVCFLNVFLFWLLLLIFISIFSLFSLLSSIDLDKAFFILLFLKVFDEKEKRIDFLLVLFLLVLLSISEGFNPLMFNLILFGLSELFDNILSFILFILLLFSFWYWSTSQNFPVFFLSKE